MVVFGPLERILTFPFSMKRTREESPVAGRSRRRPSPDSPSQISPPTEFKQTLSIAEGHGGFPLSTTQERHHPNSAVSCLPELQRVSSVEESLAWLEAISVGLSYSLQVGAVGVSVSIMGACALVLAAEWWQDEPRLLIRSEDGLFYFRSWFTLPRLEAMTATMALFNGPQACFSRLVFSGLYEEEVR